MSDNFKTDTLDSLCELIVDCPHSTPTWTTFGYVVIRNQNITDGVLDLSSPSYTDYSGYRDRTKRASPQENDIVITREAPMGRVCLIPKEPICCLGQRQVLLRADRNKISAEYLYWSLRSPFVQRQILINEGTGATVSNMRIPVLKALEIPRLASIEIENKKAKDLSNIQNKIQLNTQINQTLEQIAQALFKSWFVDFDPVRAKVQALSDGLSLEQAELAAMQAISGKTPEELTALSQTQPERYAELAETAKAFPCEMEEIDGVEVPKGWEVKRIDEVIQKIPVGKKYSSKTAFSEGLVPILDQGRSGVIGYHNDKPGVKASIEDPIIVFANHTCYMRLISYDFSAIQNVFAFKGKECNLYWLYLATLGKQEFVEYKGHFPDFLIKEIIVPPEELTELFGKYVKESFSKIFINDRENSNLAKIRDLLLPKLLNGGIQNE
jgi:type I restriction/modification specificity protein